MDTMEHATRKKVRQHPAALRQQVLMECAQPGFQTGEWARQVGPRVAYYRMPQGSVVGDVPVGADVKVLDLRGETLKGPSYQREPLMQ